MPPLNMLATVQAMPGEAEMPAAGSMFLVIALPDMIGIHLPKFVLNMLKHVQRFMELRNMIIMDVVAVLQMAKVQIIICL